MRDYSKEPYTIRITLEKGQRQLTLQLPDDFPIGLVEVTIRYKKSEEGKAAKGLSTDDPTTHP